MRQGKRIGAALMALLLLLSAAPTVWAEGQTVTIRSEEDFLDFARRCTSDVWSQSVTAELEADLDLTGLDFSGIPIFQGTFHGNGHTIRGLNLRDKGSKIGLFRTLTASAAVEDLTVEGHVEPGGSACRVGLLAGESEGAIRRCTVRGIVTAKEEVGGMVGCNGGQIQDCASAAAVSGETDTGGIAGQNHGTISGCSNSGLINTDPDQTAGLNTGGIAGRSDGVITGCSNSGKVGYLHLGYRVGGIAGLQSGAIQNCVNTGEIWGRKEVGGIVGLFAPDLDLTYGPSPADALNDSLTALFNEMGRFTDQLSAMADQGVADVQVIHDALSSIQSEAHRAGSEGHQDFQAMSDELNLRLTAIDSALDGLRDAADNFQKDADGDIDTLLNETSSFRKALGDAAASGDSGLRDAVDALDSTLAQIHSQAQQIRSHLSAMASELESLRSYLENVSALLLEGDVEGALSLPFPAMDPSGHLGAIAASVEEIPALTRALVSRWKAVCDQTSSQVGSAWREMDRSAGRIHDALTHLSDAGSALSSAASLHLDTVDREADAIRALLKSYTDGLGEKTQAAADRIDGQLTVIQDQVQAMTDRAGTDNAALHASASAVLNQLQQVRQAIYNLSREPELTVSELGEEVTEGPGLVSGCRAACTVNGDSNTGGIAGGVFPAVDGDPEETWDLEDLELLSDVTATVRAVIRDCRFDGSVVVKNDSGGGISGRCELGILLDCAARGNVETGTDYCGGIVGRTRGTVLRCAALVDLTGGSWLGGIAGKAGTLTDCRAMVTAQGDGECRGAIAGEAEDVLTGNRYLLEDLAGVDGVDYAETAQGLFFEDFSQLSGIPADFLHFSYRFTADGKTVAEIPFSYGEDLDLSQVPQPPRRNGEYGQWPDFPTTNLRRSLVLEAQFSQPLSTLSSGEEIPLLLAEGTFDPEAALAVEEMALPEEVPAGYTAVSAWRYTATGGGDTVILHLRAQDADAVAVLTGKGWQTARAEWDGSYLVWEGDAEGQIVLLRRSFSPLPLLPAVLGVLLLGTGVILHLRRRRKRTATR